MTGGDARRGRRDNGLVAAAYAAAGDVDPRVGEHLLDVLGLDGIAAYLRPATDVHPITRASSLPDRPTDRLYVDREHLQTARDLVARLTAEAAQDQDASASATAASAVSGPGSATPSNTSTDVDDDVWAQIVASFDEEVDPPSRSWPAAEDVPESGSGTVLDRPAQFGDPAEFGNPAEFGGHPSGLDRTSGLDRPSAGKRSGYGRTPEHDRTPEYGRTPAYDSDPEHEPSLLDGLDTFGAGLPDDEGDYQPPAAPPLPRPSLPTVLGVAGIIVGLVVFLKPELTPFPESAAIFLGFAALVGGFATLVWRLRPGDDDERDPDDGARV